MARRIKVARTHHTRCGTRTLQQPEPERNLIAMSDTNDVQPLDLNAVLASRNSGTSYKALATEFGVSIAKVKAAIDEAEAAAKAARGRKAGRIPAGVAEFTCTKCGETKKVSAFPTVTGPDDRMDYCRSCRDAGKSPRAPKSVDMTNEYGITGSTVAEVQASAQERHAELTKDMSKAKKTTFNRAFFTERDRLVAIVGGKRANVAA